MEIDKVKVDRKLFVTCRLCLEEMGLYQITPVISEQFKYCFDIDVSPYDGLPQLICENCQTVLSDYSTKKRIYSGRQNALHVRLQIRQEIEASLKNNPVKQNTDSSLRNSINDLNDNDQNANQNEVRSESSSPVPTRKRKQKKSTINSKSKKEWKDLYLKKIVCRFCNKQLKNKGNLSRHLQIHGSLFNRFNDVIQNTCVVNLKARCDGLLPDTHDATNTVVLGPSKIISQEKIDSITYCTIYSPKSNISTCDSGSSTSESDSDGVLTKYCNRKRRRILSTDTLILSDAGESRDLPLKETKQEDPTPIDEQDVECIAIDDSSNGSSACNDNNGDKTSKCNTDVIQNLVNLCYKKHVKKSEPKESSTKIQPGVLIHKLLSIGRKVIHKEGINSIGILRYLESKNLEIKWIVPNKDNLHVHIIPRIKSNTENEDVNWKKLSEKEVEKGNTKHRNSLSKKLHRRDSIVAGTSTSISENNDQNRNLFENISKQHKAEETLLPGCEAVLVSVDSDKKLLNANPVANPKQLPKKASATDIKWPVVETSKDKQSNGDKSMPIITSTTSLAVLYPEDDQEANVAMGLPVIQSTTSLAPSCKVDNGNTQPRIKVKPVTQLMSDEALKSFNQPAVTTSAVQLWSCNTAPAFQNVVLMVQKNDNTPEVGLVKNTQVVSALMSKPTTDSSNGNNCVILDTVTFPNTLTDSPFKYLKNLLHIHNIVLLDTDQPVPPGFACLIKFKLQFSRDSVNEPVTLCLSVYCNSNKFYLGVKDPTHGHDIDIQKLSANWQWQILKIYTLRNDVISKMTCNATKIGHIERNSTEMFLNLLGSIKLK